MNWRLLLTIHKDGGNVSIGWVRTSVYAFIRCSLKYLQCGQVKEVCGMVSSSSHEGLCSCAVWRMKSKILHVNVSITSPVSSVVYVTWMNALGFITPVSLSTSIIMHMSVHSSWNRHLIFPCVKRSSVNFVYKLLSCAALFWYSFMSMFWFVVCSWFGVTRTMCCEVCLVFFVLFISGT